ncbi:MAG: LapA family protein [Desulforegulaceae bacterium]|nr:LapA family protein [Desulforegulaceae bacterium]
MKKFKITAGLVFLALILLAGWQNQEYFILKNGLDLNFYFKKFSIPQTANGLYWIICFVTGFLLSYFSSLAFRFKAQRKIKMQNQTIENYRETVLELKNEVDKIRATDSLNPDNKSFEENIKKEEQKEKSNEVQGPFNEEKNE